MFHVELRKFPNVGRVFNLTREELEERILRPWVVGKPVEVNDRRWAPDSARISIYEGPALRSDEIGLGRGWANATRSGQDVTASLLAELQRATQAPPAVEGFKEELVARSPLELGDVVQLAGERYPQALVSERLALAERAVWELLHAGDVRLVSGGRPLRSEEWRPLLLSWVAWNRPGVMLEGRR